MANIRLPESEKSVRFSLSIKKKQLDELKKLGKPSVIIQKLVQDFLDEGRKEEK